MSKTKYLIKESKPSGVFAETYDYKQAQKVAKKLVRQTGFALIEFFNEELGMCEDERYLTREEI